MIKKLLSFIAVFSGVTLIAQVSFTNHNELIQNYPDNSEIAVDMRGIGDFNNDGFLDVVNDGNLYLNDGNANHWVKVGLEGVESNKNGIGARVKIVGEWGTQMREVRSGQGFSHMNSLLAHFGIGTSTAIESLIVEWPSGTVDVLTNPAINQSLIIEEGSTILQVDGFKKDKVALYPNPTSDLLNLSLKGLENVPVQIIDVNGKIVLTTKISNNSNINVATLKSGVYFAMLQVEKKITTYKFIKK